MRRTGLLLAATALLMAALAGAALALSPAGAAPAEPRGARSIAYTAETCEEVGPAFTCTADVARLPADGSGAPKKLTAAVMGKSLYASPAWSPDGRRIAFVGRKDGTDAATGEWGDSQNLFLTDADGSGRTNLTGHPPTSGHTPTYHDPAWFPGGKRIVYAKADRKSGYGADLYSRNVETGREVRLTSGGGNQYAPAVSPDGKRIAFMGVFDGDWDIYVMRSVPQGVDGNQPVRLTVDVPRVVEGFPPQPVQDYSPTWSPDGRQIAFSSDRDGSDQDGDQEIYRMKASPEGAENRPVRLTDNGTDDHTPAWSPDGGRIAYSGAGDIWTARASDGSRPVQLTDGPWDNSGPSWGPRP